MTENLEAPLALTTAEKLANAQSVLARITAGEIIPVGEVNPRTHGSEIVALAAQTRLGGIAVVSGL